MSHDLKYFLRVLYARVYLKCEEKSEETQFSCIKGLGTREIPFSIKLIIWECLRINLFVHHRLSKGFRQRETGYPNKHTTWSRNGQGRLQNYTRIILESDNACKGVRQGCILSRGKDLSNGCRVIKLRIPIDNIRYADYTGTLAPSLGDLPHMLDRIDMLGKRFRLIINTA